MLSIAGSMSLVLLILAPTINALPVSRELPESSAIEPRSPVVNELFADWATNVLMIGSSQTFGMWLPMDGTWYDLSTITCLDLPAYALGPCSSPTIDQIGVVAGDGPCSFKGSAGYKGTIDGLADEGYYTVGPPQQILQARCK